MKNPPIAPKKEFSYKIHNKSIEDDYQWLRDKDWPNVKNQEIIDYLESENKYFENFFAGSKNLKEEIFNELKGRVKLEDQSVPVKDDNYYYYTRTEADKEYPIYCRRNGSMDAPEEIILDVNELAKGKSFTQVGATSVSQDHKLLSFAVDFKGDENYVIKVLDLSSKKYLDDVIENTAGDIVWHQNMSGFFYTPRNKLSRTDKVFFHKLGTKQDDDKLIFEEKDQIYQVSISQSNSEDYLFIDDSGSDSNEIYILDIKNTSDLSQLSPKLCISRKDTIFYSVEHNGDYFYVATNDGATYFQVIMAGINDFENNDSWTIYVPEKEGHYLNSIDITKKYLVLGYKIAGIDTITVKDLVTGDEKTVNFPEPTYAARGFATNFKEDEIRLSYSSFRRPATTYQYDFESDGLSVLKVQEIPSGFNPDEYEVERVFADNEGIKIPVSLFYKKSLFKKDGSNPLFLYGYGSYGISMPDIFNNSAVSLANRGFVFAMAHIRGGDELGNDWHEAAKFLNKKRTFDDFIESAEYLIKEKYTSKGNIVISGASAGGMLIGAVINERPELFKAAIAHVPFVDVVNTMLDESLPLTPGEFKEWGNPKDPVYFDYMISYSPYENVKPQAYPNLMVTCGISDPRVGYWEAAKWVAKLRANKTDHNTIILKTNMTSGHTGASGRFDFLKEKADDIVFIMKIFDIKTISKN